jgi:hypothetical protein
VRTLADRLGVNRHVSPLRFKLERLAREYPLPTAAGTEAWLMSVAYARGFRIVDLAGGDRLAVAPPEDRLSNEELAIAMCQTLCIDEPQMLRLPAQMISRKAVNTQNLVFCLCGVADHGWRSECGR